MNATGRPVQELTDEELEAQGTFTGTEEDSTLVVGNPVRCLLTKLAEQPGGRMHKLELHQPRGNAA